MGRYDCDLFGSDFRAADNGCDDRYSGFTARWPAAGWEDGMVWAVLDSGRRRSTDSNCCVNVLFVEKEKSSVAGVWSSFVGKERAREEILRKVRMGGEVMISC